MGFSIIHGDPQIVSMPVEPGEVIYTGSIISCDAGTPLEGIQPLPVAVGASNTTNKDVPLGIVIGNNNERDGLESDGDGSFITQVAAGTPYESTTQYRNLGGPYVGGDPQAFVKVALIDPCTVIRGPIFNAAVGTAPTVVTVTTGSGTDGIGCTTGASDVATVANFATLFPRSGQNMGVYRTLTSASTTTHTWLKAMKADMAVGDTAVVINGLRPYGVCIAQFDAEAGYVDCNAALTTNYFKINVVKLDLSTPGNEFVDFKFDGDNFCTMRA